MASNQPLQKEDITPDLYPHIPQLQDRQQRKSSISNNATKEPVSLSDYRAKKLRESEGAAATQTKQASVAAQENNPFHYPGNPQTQQGNNASSNAVSKYLKRWIIGIALGITTATPAAMIAGTTNILQ